MSACSHIVSFFSQPQRNWQQHLARCPKCINVHLTQIRQSQHECRCVLAFHCMHSAPSITNWNEPCLLHITSTCAPQAYTIPLLLEKSSTPKLLQPRVHSVLLSSKPHLSLSMCDCLSTSSSMLFFSQINFISRKPNMSCMTSPGSNPRTTPDYRECCVRTNIGTATILQPEWDPEILGT